MVLAKLYDITLPLLQFLNDQNLHSRTEITNHLANHFNLTEEERNKLKPSGGQTVFQNRVDWARFELKKGGLIEVLPDKSHKITSDGIEALKKNSEKIDRKYLLTVPKYYEYFHKLNAEEKEEETTISIDENTSPEDMVITGFTEYRKNLESEILSQIMQKDPDFFERLVLDLIVKMGYGRGTVTGRSGDGGVDGMINEDTLGLSQIYLQAKRYQGTVPAGDVRDFAGSLDAKKSKKGVFLTTSNFSSETRKFVEETSSKIVLINGKKLVGLMFEHKVGFSQGDVYQLNAIDEDYFS